MLRNSGCVEESIFSIQYLVIIDGPNGGLYNDFLATIGSHALSEVLSESRPRFRLDAHNLASIDRDGVARLLTIEKSRRDRLRIACNASITIEEWRLYLQCVQNPVSKIELLELHDCNINDEVAAIIAKALAETPSLKFLSIVENQSLPLTGWEVFFNGILTRPSRCPLERIRIPDQDAVKLEPILCRCLCDKSGIDNIYSSNHTLVGVDTVHLSMETREFVYVIHWTQELLSLLKMNENVDKAVAAREKILVFHFYTGAPTNIQVFDRMPIAILPHALEWIGRGESRRGFSLLYTLVKEFPTLFCKRSDGDSQNCAGVMN